ncbi:YggS family pyridoxal phosphate-dependent enzyme [Candidatus Pelagibacter sp.]|uniref:YggS family pyridoxal phosphate-dependent enzyme n=1 Tax=Candidatus Pelagibacter sp. TaxID=2024849 RepID=UPI003D14E6C9
MHDTVKKFIDIINIINSKLEDHKNIALPKVIAVSKTFKLEKIFPLIDYGHLHYGENKVQEAVDKWKEVKLNNSKIKLHLIGRLQRNKVKYAINIFDYIHSLDNKKLAKKIYDEEIKQNKKIKIFLQVNIGNEAQKSGINKDELGDLYNYCKELNLDIIGLMCIPPENENPEKYFQEMSELNKKYNFLELSMGMSSDYLKALESGATYLRIGSSIFGNRT